MISSCAALRFWAQRAPLPDASNSASAGWRASASVLRIWARTMARAAVDLGASSPIAASSSPRMISADFSANSGFRRFASASASVVTDFLQLVERFDRLLGGHLVGSDGVERNVNLVLQHRPGSRLMREQRQIV